MSTCKITYNGNEISAVDETAPVSVAYNNATIATLNDGDTKTLGCHGKAMSSDVVIGIKTLNCNGKLMQGDIVVELVGSATGGRTWYFNDTIEKHVNSIIANFKSNVAFYRRIYKNSKTNFLCYEKYDGQSSVFVYNYNNNKWTNEAFRTIVLDEPATGDVLAFLEANATKIS